MNTLRAGSRNDLTGQTFTRWYVVGRAGSDRFGAVTWTCRCSCGEVRAVRGSDLRAQTSRSCGCLPVEGPPVRPRKQRATGYGVQRKAYRNGTPARTLRVPMEPAALRLALREMALAARPDADPLTAPLRDSHTPSDCLARARMICALRVPDADQLLRLCWVLRLAEWTQEERQVNSLYLLLVRGANPMAVSAALDAVRRALLEVTEP